MEAIKEALEYAVDLSPAKLHVVGEETYSDKRLYRVDRKELDLAEPIPVNTLTSLVDYIKQNIDEIERESLFINVISSTEVTLQSVLNIDRKRETIMHCKAQIPSILYNMFYDRETFNILMQSAFDRTDDRDIILKVIGNLTDENVRTIGDDGVSQAVTIRESVANLENVKVPNPVILKPYRSFAEIEQIESKFVFRIKDGGSCALFEADGGAWKLSCKERIKLYLSQALADLDTQIMIIG